MNARLLIPGIVLLASASPAFAITIGAPQPVFAVSNALDADPTDEDLRLLTVFNDRLVPMPGDPAEGENAALAAALNLFQQRVDPEDISMLQAFITAHPSSRWNASLLLNLGLERYEWGYLSQALQFWESAWQLAAPESDPALRAIADRAIGELLVLNARLGRRAVVEQLLLDIADRPIEGSVALNVQGAREGVTRMRLQPQIAFKCGPFALNSILNHLNNTPTLRHEVLEAAQSSPEGLGTNLLQLRDWAAAVGLNYQVAYKDASGPLITPAVMHWRLDHFAALLSERDGRYLVQDATFGGEEMFLTARALEAETDGFFLVPAGPLPAGWRTVSDAEAATVWGKGGAPARVLEVNGPKANPDCGCPGMPWVDYYLMRASSNIQDVPLFYDPPIGPRVSFMLNYNQDEPGSPEINTHAHLGSNWDFNWISYLEVDAHYTARVRLRHGGSEVFRFSLFNNATNAYPPDPYSQAVLKWTTDEFGRDVYRRELSDGSAEVYSQPGQPGTIGRFYLKQIVDPQGNAVTINYEVYPGGTTINYSNPPEPGEYTNPNVTKPKWTGRINEIIDAAGGATFIRYVSDKPSHAGFRKIRAITTPDDRQALFTYDGTGAKPGHLAAIQDAVGMTSTFSYATDGFIEVMNTPYGRTLFHRYNQAGSFTMHNPGDTNDEGQLIIVNDFMRGLRITYPDGSTAVVESWLGTHMSTFHWNRLLTKHHPLEPQLGNPAQYQNCEIYKWRLVAGANELSGMPYSYKAPLQEEISFNYQGSSEAVTGDEENPEVTHAYAGTSNQPTETFYNGQTYSTAYNMLGNVTQSADPLGRVTKLYYDGNGVDLLELRRVNGAAEDLLAKFLYNDRHLPVKIFNAAGHATELAYNAYGQVISRKDALGNITTYGYFNQYDTNQTLPQATLLEFVNGPLAGDQDKITFTYDAFLRPVTVTDPDGIITHYQYDALNRLTKIIHQPPGVAIADCEYEEVIYDRLDPILIRDRQGRWTKRDYDSMGRLVSETDPEGRRIELDWCTCGSLSKLKDANGRITQWIYDDLGRVTKKIRADGREENFAYYPNQNRLHHVTTAGETRRVYTYRNDESIHTVTYQRRIPEADPPEFEDDPATPAVIYSYDSKHPRITSVSSSVGSINYQYHPYRQSAQAAVLLGAGALSRVETSVLNGTNPAAAILYQYDALGRAASRSIESFIDNQWEDDNHSVSWQYDAVSRLTSMTNVLGQFDYAYDQPSKGLSRLASVTYPNGQVTSYDWHPAAQHHRLAAITHKKADTTLISSYGYSFAKGGQLRAWTQKVGTDPLEHWQIEHNDAEQLRSVIAREGGPTGTILRQQFYDYDPAGNRVGYQDGHSIRALSYNNLNQITDQPTSGPIRFEGTIDEPGTVNINDQPANMRTVLDENDAPTFRFAADVPLSNGLNQVEIAATDGSDNTTTELYEVSVTDGSTGTPPSYDARGNMTSNGRGQSYEWDVLNRLLAIQYADGTRTEFTYDALSRRIRILEKDDQGEPVTDKRLLWEGTDITQERDASNAVLKRYEENGLALANNSKFFYTQDHLGSIRQVTDEDEIVVEHYAYDPDGVVTASAPGGPNHTRLADFRYTGHHFHEKSGLHLAMYRAYDPELGVWISEDPIEERGGLNLYGYVGNGPVMAVDLLGLFDVWVNGEKWESPIAGDLGHPHKHPDTGQDMGHHLHGPKGQKYFPRCNMIKPKGGKPVDAGKAFQKQFQKAVDNQIRSPKLRNRIIGGSFSALFALAWLSPTTEASAQLRSALDEYDLLKGNGQDTNSCSTRAATAVNDMFGPTAAAWAYGELEGN